MPTRKRVPEGPGSVDFGIREITDELFGSRTPRATVSRGVAAPTKGIIGDAVGFNSKHDRTMLNPMTGMESNRGGNSLERSANTRPINAGVPIVKGTVLAESEAVRENIFVSGSILGSTVPVANINGKGSSEFFEFFEEISTKVSAT